MFSCLAPTVEKDAEVAVESPEAWNDYLRSCLGEGCIGVDGAALATKADGKIFAWRSHSGGTSVVEAHDYEREIETEPGKTTTVTISESARLKDLIEKGPRETTDLWIGGKRYRIVYDNSEQEGDVEFRLINGRLLGESKKGFFIMPTRTLVIIALYTFDNHPGGLFHRPNMGIEGFFDVFPEDEVRNVREGITKLGNTLIEMGS